MTKKILDLIKKDEIRVIGKRTDAKVGIKSSELKPFVMQHKQEIIDIYFEEEKEIERLAEIAKETGKPQVLKENTSWNPDKGIPVIDYTLVNTEGKTYLYTKELE